MITRSSNLVPIDDRIPNHQRSHSNKHDSGTIWLTGLPSSGKSTLAVELEKRLFYDRFQVYMMDGDGIRSGLSSDLGFSPSDRTENIRRIGEVAALFSDAGIIVITAFISPYQRDRDLARKTSPTNFKEVFIKASIDTCEERDPKGHYKLARQGKLADFTGISAPYEEPENPDLIIDTNTRTVTECSDDLYSFAKTVFTNSS